MTERRPAPRDDRALPGQALLVTAPRDDGTSPGQREPGTARHDEGASPGRAELGMAPSDLVRATNAAFPDSCCCDWEDRSDFEAAERHYRAALGSEDDATARFNLGVVLEDQQRFDEARDAYLELLEIDDSYADAHYNLAGLYERQDRKDAALRHLKAYKSLTEPRG